MFRFSALFPRIQPTGFIFHISRCGSTLLANALKTANQVLVVAAPRHGDSASAVAIGRR
jgi:hypothetical protein